MSASSSLISSSSSSSSSSSMSPPNIWSSMVLFGSKYPDKWTSFFPTTFKVISWDMFKSQNLTENFVRCYKFTEIFEIDIEHLFEPLPNRFAYIMARGCRNRGRHAFLCGGEPFCHQTGPYQTLLAETWWSQLLVRFRVFFDFRKYRNHLNEVQKFRDVLFLEKKASARNAPHRSPEWGWSPESKYPDIQISRYPDIQMSRCPDIQISGIRYQISGIRHQKKYMWKSPTIVFF